MVPPWPPGFARTPDEEWTRAPVDSLAAKYDAVEKHGWYANLDPTADEIVAWMPPGGTLIDYSGGTGILLDRLAERGAHFGMINVDSSPKFLALCLAKFRDDERVAFRLIRFLKDEKRLQWLDEVLPLRGVDALVSANAIHLYYDLEDTLRSWRRVLRTDGRVFVQSGNIRNPDAPAGSWIIDDTVEAMQRAAQDIIREDARFAAYRDRIGDARYDALRRKFFLPPRPLALYVDALRGAGFEPVRIEARPVRAKTSEWFDFLAVYHEGVLGWVGGSERIEGREPTQAAVKDRLLIMRAALERVLHGRDHFDATWTYVTCKAA